LLGAALAGMLFIYYTRDLPRPEKYSEKIRLNLLKFMTALEEFFYMKFMVKKNAIG